MVAVRVGEHRYHRPRDEKKGIAKIEDDADDEYG